MFDNFRRILLTLPFVLMTGVLVSSIHGALADHNPGHSISTILSLEARVMALETLTSSMTANAENVYFTGVNVHVRNGTNSTDGMPNGLGNLIVGYDELRSGGTAADKNGSHNLIVGRNHNYTSFGGLVAGFENTISGSEASVSGGTLNTASGPSASVSGGESNNSSGQFASISQTPKALRPPMAKYSAPNA